MSEDHVRFRAASAPLEEAAKTSSRAWARILAAYRTPSGTRASAELAMTLIPFAGLWWALYASLAHDKVWLYALLLLPAAGLLVRLFLIQHDCGHRACFRGRLANDWVGRMLSLLTLTPYDHWRRAHAIHHATSGDLDRRGVGDVDTLSVAEYVARPRWGRLRYRMYRHPLVLFGVGPAYLFFFQNRFPAGFIRGGWAPWSSTMGTNVALVVASAVLMASIGVGPFLAIEIPVVLLAAAAGVWLFYVQHQFESTYWAKGAEWNAGEAALYGSSHLELPWILRWFTANIGVHHVHHLSSGIPFYRLPKVLDDHPRLRSVGRLTLRQSARCVRLVLWDERSQRLVTFKHALANAAPRSR